MAEDNRSAGNRYGAFKNEVWNKGRTAQAIDRLHQYRVPEEILESVAEKFARGRQGEGEFVAAVTTEFLQNRNRAVISRQMEELRGTIAKIHQELVWVASRLHHLKNWRSHRILEYENWAGFLQKELGLSEEVAGLLMRIGESERGSRLDTVIQNMMKGFATGPGSTAEQQGRAHKNRVRTDKRDAKRTS